MGTLVTALPRRRPLVVARQTASLDRLSGGRLILGVGTGGGPFEWDFCGEQPDPRVRGDMLDEHLELLTRLWTGDPVHFEGVHYRVAGPDWSGICHPPPLQAPPVPIWVGGAWPGGRPFRRAARWDGVAPIPANGSWSLKDTIGLVGRIKKLRSSDAPFDVAVPGVSDPNDDTRHEVAAEHSAAGATWWIEALDPWRYGWTEGAPWPLSAYVLGSSRPLTGPRSATDDRAAARRPTTVRLQRASVKGEVSGRKDTSAEFSTWSGQYHQEILLAHALHEGHPPGHTPLISNFRQTGSLRPRRDIQQGPGPAARPGWCRGRR